MRKKLLFLLLAVVACFVGAKADELTVADGTSTNAFVPLYGAYADAYQKCEFIIPATDLEDMVGGTITDLTWYLSQPATADWGAAGFIVFMKTVEGTTVSAFTGYDDATVVYTGSLDGTQETMSIELSDAFSYTGGNLLIGVYQTVKGSFKSSMFYGQAATGASMMGYSTSALSSINGTQRNFIPKTTFTYESEQVDYKVRVTPESLAFGSLNVGTEKEITVTVKNVGQQAITPTLGTVNAPFSVNYTSTELAYGQSVQIPVKFAPTAAGEYNGQLVINCGGAGEVNLDMSGSAVLARDVCDGTNTNNYLPFFGKWTDTQGTFGQMLYPASEFVGLEGATITGVVFYPTAAMELSNPTIELSLKATDETAYTRTSSSSAPDNLVTGLTAVASTTIANGATELVFDFTTPFVYEGGNLAVQALVTAAGGWKDTYFYGVNQTANTGYSQYSSSKTLCQFLPKMTLFYTLPAPPAPESVTLAEALAGEEGDVLIGSDMKVVVANSDYAIVSDGQGNWLRVIGQDLEQDTYITNMAGVISPEEVNPIMEVTSYEPSDAVVEVETGRLDLRTIHRTELTALKPNEVATFVGYYKDGQLCAFSSGSGLHIDMTTENMVGTISTGKQQAITAVVSLKQAWDAPAPTNGPARVAIDDDQAFENIKIDATSASTPTGIDGIKAIDGNAIDGKVNVYNMQGQLIKRGVEAGVAAQGLPAGIYLIGNKKVVVK